MKASDLHPSKYIKSDDLRGKPHTVVISHVTIEEVGNNEKKPVIHFQGKPKGMVLNVTNTRRIAMFCGDETDLWIGKEIVVYPELTQDKSGKPVWGIRVRPPEPAAPMLVNPPQQPPPPNPVADMSDEIPF